MKARATTPLRRLPFDRFLKFCAVGGSGVLVNMGVYLVLTRSLGLIAELSQALSILASIGSNFALNDVWTFRDRRGGGLGGQLRRVTKFYVTSLAGALVQWSVSMALFRFARLDDRLSVLVGIGVATGWNFTVNVLWTWRRGPQPVSGLVGELAEPH